MVIFLFHPEVLGAIELTTCEVTDGMAFGSIAVVAVNRLTMMFGKRVGPFPTTHRETTSPKVIGPNLVFLPKMRDEFLLVFLQIR